MKNTLSVITALFVGFGIASSVDAGVISGYTLSGSTLSTITIDGTTHTATNLINGTLTAANDQISPAQMLFSSTGAFPSGNESSLLEDLKLDTGIANVQNLTFTFDTPIVNTGTNKIDLIIFDWGGFLGNPNPPVVGDDKFQVVIDGVQGNARAIGPAFQDTMPDQGPGGDYFNNASIQLSARVFDDNDTYGSVAELEMLDFSFASNSQDQAQGVIGLDLTDFGISVGNTATMITINDQTDTSIDPTLILGIQGPQAVPEPSSVALMCVGGAMSLFFRRRRSSPDRSIELFAEPSS